MDSSSTRTLLLVGVFIGLITFGASAAVLDAQNTSGVSDGVTLGAPDGMNATIGGTTEVNLEQFDDFGSDTVRFFTPAGNVSLSSSGPAAATIDNGNITGTYTNVTAIDATSNDITVNPEDKQSVVLGGQIDSVAWRDNPALDDSTVDFFYAGNSGTSKVVIGNLPANTEMFAVDADTGTLLDRATSNGNGVVTLSSLDNSAHNVLLQSPSDDSPVIQDIRPSGDLDKKATQIAVDVTDQDFANLGDTVSVDISLDGTTLSTQTITSNGTVTTSIPNSGQTGGVHDITATASDSFGNSDTSSTTYRVPNTFFIRNETNHSELVAADGSVRFFTDDAVFERSAPNGEFNMTGLPVDESFFVEIDPTEQNLTERTIFISSIYAQESAYVLNTTAFDTVENRFTLDDPTGNYDSESTLFISRPINVSGDTKYQTIVSDRFGVEGVTTTLQENIRYQLRVRGDGISQDVGPFRADVSETVSVEPGSPTIALTNASTFGPAYNVVLENDTLEYRYSDPAEETDLLTVFIHERGNKSNQLAPNQTFTDLGNASAIVSLSGDEINKEWAVKYVVNRNNEEYVITNLVANQKNLGPPLDPNLTTMIGIGVLFIFAGSFSVLNAGVGAVLVSLIGGLLWFLGFLGATTSGIAIVGALLISVLGHMLSGTR
jgi:hypothetical protein